jgi:hypothetical protein
MILRLTFVQPFGVLIGVTSRPLNFGRMGSLASGRCRAVPKDVATNRCGV